MGLLTDFLTDSHRNNQDDRGGDVQSRLSSRSKTLLCFQRLMGVVRFFRRGWRSEGHSVSHNNHLGSARAFQSVIPAGLPGTLGDAIKLKTFLRLKNVNIV